MTISKLKKSDNRQVAPLIQQLTKNIVKPDKLLERIKNLTDQENSRFLVVKKDNRAVGIGGLVWYYIPSKGLVGWIEEVVVDSEYRNQGIGQKILQELLKLAVAKNLKQVKLTSSNPIAKHIYQKLGFAKKEEDLFIFPGRPPGPPKGGDECQPGAPLASGAKGKT